MKGTWNVRPLIDAVRGGHLIGSVVVDQIYAHYQHEGIDFEHPDGGGPNYLRNWVFADSDARMKMMAEVLILPDGSGIVQAMADSMENLSSRVFDNAPWEFGDLRESGHPSVTHDGELVYDRAPHVERLSEEDLAEKNRLSRKYDPDRYARSEKHAGHTNPLEHEGARIRQNLPPNLRPR